MTTTLVAGTHHGPGGGAIDASIGVPHWALIAWTLFLVYLAIRVYSAIKKDK